MSNDAKPPEQKPSHATIMVGHSVDLETNESGVVIYCTGGNRLSIDGARIVAAQITQWADHAEKRNAERPKDTMMRFMYKVVQDASIRYDDDPNVGNPGYLRKRRPYTTDQFEWVPVEPAEGASGIEVSSEPAPKKVEVHVKLRCKKPPVRKIGKSKRGKK